MICMQMHVDDQGQLVICHLPFGFILFCVLETGPLTVLELPIVGQAGTYLSLPPQLWDYMCMPPCQHLLCGL